MRPMTSWVFHGSIAMPRPEASHINWVIKSHQLSFRLVFWGAQHWSKPSTWKSAFFILFPFLGGHIWEKDVRNEMCQRQLKSMLLCSADSLVWQAGVIHFDSVFTCCNMLQRYDMLWKVSESVGSRTPHSLPCSSWSLVVPTCDPSRLPWHFALSALRAGCKPHRPTLLRPAGHPNVLTSLMQTTQATGKILGSYSML